MKGAVLSLTNVRSLMFSLMLLLDALVRE
jgi:hypothetical protein